MMGMYTELYLSVGMKENLPIEVVNVLKFLFGNGGDTPKTLPDHKFFKCDRWSMIGRCSSFYFVPFNTSRLYYSDTSNQYYFTTRSDLKNYDSEIEKFLDWVMPYIDNVEGEHLGHWRYEENDEPTLIYKTAS